MQMNYIFTDLVNNLYGSKKLIYHEFIETNMNDFVGQEKKGTGVTLEDRQCLFLFDQIIYVFQIKIKMTDLDSTEILTVDESFTDNSSTNNIVCQ